MTDKPKLAKCSSAAFGVTFYGILNAEGDFWTPAPFQSEEAARKYIRDFWGRQTDQAESCLRTHSIVPVRVNLTEIRR